MSMCLQAINLNTFTHQSRTRIPVHNRTLVNVNSHLRISPIWNIRKGIITACSAPSQEILQQKLSDEDENSSSDAENSDSVENEQQVVVEFSANESIWNQTVEIIKFSGPAVGLWLSGPLMSLIDTAVVGQGSSIELAALGPGTVFCDNTSYIFMFLSIATSNLVATSLARQDKDQVQHQISILIFLGLVFGVLMFFCTRLFGIRALTSFTGAKNIEIINSANTYIQIRGLAWPALLVGWVAQSASLGMKDSWGPLKALAVATVINGIGDIVLCRVFSYGIAGAAWATMVSQRI
uniref:DNA-damage-inducible protein f n=1 Tax=Solanum tuberosum TaxID=4113 RepID=M0ZV32_SOLTU